MGGSSESLENILREGVLAGEAPGAFATVFDKDTIIASAGSAAPDRPVCEPKESLVWMASMSKLVASLAALRLAEQKSIRLDSHDDLKKVLPEFDLNSESPVTKIIEGWNDASDPTKGLKMREAKVGVTLRQLLNHTSGFSIWFNDEYYAKMTASNGQDMKTAMNTGAIAGFESPLVFEPGTQFRYSHSMHWIAQFIIRLSKKSLRQTQEELVLIPLGVDPNDMSPIITEEMGKRLWPMHSRTPEGFIEIPFRTVQDDNPQKGFGPGPAGLWGTFTAYTKILQYILAGLCGELKEDLILSREMFKEATDDDLAKRNMKIENPIIKSSNFQTASNIDSYIEGSELGWSLLTATVVRNESNSGLSPGTLSWAGLANTFFFIDPHRKIGCTFGSQFFPFGDSEVLKLRDRVWKWAVENANVSLSC